jgi:hypothetical protein
LRLIKHQTAQLDPSHHAFAMPSFFGPRRTAVFAALFAGAALLSSCNEFMYPCTEADEGVFVLTNTRKMQGVYPLSAVDGRAIPTSGYVIPVDGGKLLRGELTFYTFSIDKGNCFNTEESSGEIIALYQLTKPDGTVQPTQTQVGSFSFNNISRVLTIRALGHTATTRVKENLTGFTLIAPIPIPFLGDVTFTLGFGQ